MAIAPLNSFKTIPVSHQTSESPFMVQSALKSSLGKVFWGLYLFVPFISFQLAHFLHPSPVMQYYFDAAMILYMLVVGMGVWNAGEYSQEIWRLFSRIVVVLMSWMLLSLLPAFNIATIPTPANVTHHYQAQQNEWLFLQKHHLPLTLLPEEYQQNINTDPTVKLQEYAEQAYSLALNTQAAKSFGYWGVNILLACLSLLALTLTLRYGKR